MTLADQIEALRRQMHDNFTGLHDRLGSAESQLAGEHRAALERLRRFTAMCGALRAEQTAEFEAARAALFGPPAIPSIEERHSSKQIRRVA